MLLVAILQLLRGPILEPNSSHDRVKKGPEGLLTLTQNITINGLAIVLQTQKSLSKHCSYMGRRPTPCIIDAQSCVPVVKDRNKIRRLPLGFTQPTRKSNKCHLQQQNVARTHVGNTVYGMLCDLVSSAEVTRSIALCSALLCFNRIPPRPRPARWLRCALIVFQDRRHAVRTWKTAQPMQGVWRQCDL